MLVFSVGKNMEKRYNKRGGNREGNDTFMSNTNCQDFEK